MNMPFIGILIIPLVLLLLAFILVGVVMIALRLKKNYGLPAAIGFVLFLFVVPPTLMLLVRFSAIQRVQVADRSRAEVISRDGNVDWGDALTTNRLTSDVRRTPRDVRSIRSVPIRVEAQPNAPAAAWSSNDLDDFQASLYPSLMETAAPLAGEIAEQLESDDLLSETTVFVVHADDSLEEFQSSFQTKFVRSLKDRLPDAEVVEADDARGFSVEPKENEFVVRLSAFLGSRQACPWNPQVVGPYGAGYTRSRIQSANRTTERRLQFVPKIWVSSLERLVSVFPDKQFVVGYSDQLASSEPQARQLAMKNAQAQVRIAAGNGVNTLIDDSMVIDRFAQKLSRPYGDVWREAVLVDITGEAMRGNAAIAVARANRSSTLKTGTALTTVLLVLATVVICFVANMLTQGYYRRPIKISGTGVAIAAIIFSFVLFICIG